MHELHDVHAVISDWRDGWSKNEWAGEYPRHMFEPDIKDVIVEAERMSTTPSRLLGSPESSCSRLIVEAKSRGRLLCARCLCGKERP